MTAMCAANGGDLRRVPRSREPVVNSSPNLASADRRLARPVVAGNQENHAIAGIDGSLERAVDRLPCTVEILAVKIDGPIGFDIAAPDPLVPASIERRSEPGWSRLRRAELCRSGPDRSDRLIGFRRPLSRLGRRRLARKRLDRGRHSRPEFCLFRAERAHGPRRPWATGSEPAPTRTCRRPARPLPHPHPRKCRTGSGP